MGKLQVWRSHLPFDFDVHRATIIMCVKSRNANSEFELFVMYSLSFFLALSLESAPALQGLRDWNDECDSKNVADATMPFKYAERLFKMRSRIRILSACMPLHSRPKVGREGRGFNAPRWPCSVHLFLRSYTNPRPFALHLRC